MSSIYIVTCQILKLQEGMKDAEKWWRKSSDSLKTETGTLLSAYMVTCSHLEMKIIVKETAAVGDAAAGVVAGIHLQEVPEGDGGYPPSYCIHNDGQTPAGTSYTWKLSSFAEGGSSS